tara:strand:- start:487 stop:1470 length:984 start_codon:yes stop_codon:yes gene_type:complete
MNLTKAKLQQIILEEIDRVETDQAAEDIVDDLESFLTEAEESFLKKVYNKIFSKSQEQNLDADQLAIQTYKKMKQRSSFRTIVAGLTLAAFIGGFNAYQDTQSQAQAYAAGAQKSAQTALKHIEGQKSEDAIEQLNKKLSVSTSFAWSLDPESQPKTMDDLVASMDSADSSKNYENFPLWQDYNLGIVQMLSQEYGVVLKVKQDIQKQIDAGVKNKEELRPLIDLDSVRDPDFTAEQFAQNYKFLYDIPEFDPKKTDEEDIGGNAEKVSKKTKDQIKFLKLRKGAHMGYETYALLDYVNPELPNEKMSPSQYYIKLFNEVTGQNIQP